MTGTIATGQEETVADKPPYRGTRLHAMRIPDDIWDAALTRAAEDGSNVTAETVAFLRAYATGQPYTLKPQPKRRRPNTPPT